MGTLSLSTTGISDAASCLHKYEQHFVDRLIPLPTKISRAMRRGIWLHRCLQDHHCGRDWSLSLTALEDQATGWGVEDAGEIADECLLYMRAYTQFYARDNWKVIADE